MMKTRFLGFLLLIILFCSAQLGVLPSTSVKAENTPDVFVGIDLAYGNIDQIKQWVDEVSSYTNLFVLGCTGVTQNRLELEEACQYLFDKGMFFIVYQDYPLDFSWFSNDKSTWLLDAKARWGSHFMGFYYMDEVGGRQLDFDPHWTTVKKADNYTSASIQFNDRTSHAVDWFRNSYSGGQNVTLFMSDYAFYHFDYQAGYDVLLAQFGWNYSRQLNAALCRGAATAQEKPWGVMITWTYRQPPYIESGEELYNDLLIAYDSGAKYILVFNSNKMYTDNILMQEHLDALKQFWQYSQQNPRKSNLVSDRTAYVLPKDYAYGFRGPNDKIWGLWEADNLSSTISIELGNLLQQYNFKLDIIYQDSLGLGSTQEYQSVIYSNSSAVLSKNSQGTLLKQNPNGTSNLFLLSVLIIISATLIVTFSSKFYLKRTKNIKKLKK
jgi:hypothetical protein